MCKKLAFLIPYVVVLGLILSSTASAELVGWWKLDDGSGTIAVDSSGYGRDGTLEGDPQWVTGKFGGALEFDGDDYVDTGYTEDLAIWTISCWVISPFAPATGDPSGPIHREQNYQINWTHTATTWQGSAGVNVGGWRNATFGELEGNRWYHLAATYDGEELKAYTDGALIASSDAMSGDPAPETNSLKFARHAMSEQYFIGTVDDVKIYNHVLSEFDLRAIAAPNYQQAWKPRPVESATDLLLDAKLVWNQGIISDETFDVCNEHHIYIGTVFEDVNTATEPTAVVTDANEYSLTLDYDTTYYWRIDEVSSLEPDNPVKGEVWSFSSANFIVMDDFEDYNDWEPDTVYLTWIDGWGDNANGSTAGYPEPIFISGEHYMETTLVHGGSQSMPIFYDNSAGISEVTKTFNDDWTRDDVITLTLFYYGDANNVVEPLYVALDDAVVTHDNPRAVLDNYWTQWDIALQEFADQGVDLANISTMSIGMGDRANPQGGGGAGFVFIDDVRLYRSPPVESEAGTEPVDPGTDNLLAYYAFDDNTEDSSGNGLHATMEGNPRYVSGLANYNLGMALEFDASFDHIVLPIGSAIAGMNDITVACWIDFSNEGGNWQRIWDFGTGEEVYMFLTPRTGADGPLRFAIKTAEASELSISAPATLPSRWHHVAASIDSSSMTMKLYRDGQLVAERETPFLPSDLGETTQNWLGRSQFAADDFYLGSIDEVRIYDRALSVAEVRYLAGK